MVIRLEILSLELFFHTDFQNVLAATTAAALIHDVLEIALKQPSQYTILDLTDEGRIHLIN